MYLNDLKQVTVRDGVKKLMGVSNTITLGVSSLFRRVVIPKGHNSENTMTVIIPKGHYSENKTKVIIPKIT